MRILHISTRLIVGGSQENTILSCEGQARLGREVHLAYGPIYGPEGSMLARVEAFNARCEAGEERTRDGGACTPIGLHEVSHLRREIHPWHDFRCWWELYGLVKRVLPNIVHTHSSKAGILGRWAAERRICVESAKRPPFVDDFETPDDGWSGAAVHTIHGPPFMPVEGGLVSRTKTRIKNRIYTLAERHAAKRCRTIVSVADAMTEQYLARGIGKKEQYVTVRSGMEVERFLDAAAGEDRESVRRELGLSGSDYVVGTVARLAQHKGHDDLLDALGDELRGRDDWKLLWVGDGWWKDRLMHRVEEMGLQGKAITTGLVPPERVPALIRAMDVLAHPSYREGLPRTVPQALLCGVTPIAYDVDGTGEACRNNETGVLVAPGDLDALRAGVVMLYEDPHERANLAERGRAECRELFSAERMVEELERVYERALSP